MSESCACWRNDVTLAPLCFLICRESKAMFTSGKPADFQSRQATSSNLTYNFCGGGRSWGRRTMMRGWRRTPGCSRPSGRPCPPGTPRRWCTPRWPTCAWPMTSPCATPPPRHASPAPPLQSPPAGPEPDAACCMGLWSGEEGAARSLELPLTLQLFPHYLHYNYHLSILEIVQFSLSGFKYNQIIFV